ncbi:acyltransferase [Suillus lakei]|nr:acyltransferase [Suillus lakei]
MELMIVYRFLRKISDWTMSGFYSEVCITGGENVPRDGPVIIAATHHNEIVDIAALSATISYRRRVCYWAKSSLFKNPISAALLTSSGSIPVYRNPNSSSSSFLSNSNSSQADLFRHTSAALTAGEVIGVFPEGTSYTEPGIVQVKDGAAWAAVEYAKAMHLSGKESKELVIVPAAIVYTDKSKYQSRVCVRYGKSIPAGEYAARLDPENAESTRVVVKEITAAIESQLKHLTVNAPDWKTLRAACAARMIFWKNEDRIPLDRFVDISQRFVEALSPRSEAMETRKAILNRYLALLHFTGTSHSALEDLYPFVDPNEDFPMRTLLFPSRIRAVVTLLLQLGTFTFHPRALLFFPVFVVHIPGYITGWFAARMLTIPNEEETKAQFKAIFGGLGFALSYGLLTRACVKLAVKFTNPVHPPIREGGLAVFINKALRLPALCGCLARRQGSLKSALGTLVMAVGMTWSLWKWHNALVYANYRQWKCFLTAFRVFTGLLLPPSFDLPADQLLAYSAPPLPAENPYIKRYVVEDPPRSSSAPVGEATHTLTQSCVRNIDNTGPGAQGLPVPTRQLIRHLFFARYEACRVLRQSSDGRMPG